MQYSLYADVYLLWNIAVNSLFFLIIGLINDGYIKIRRIILCSVFTSLACLISYIYLYYVNVVIQYLIYVGIYIFMLFCFCRMRPKDTYSLFKCIFTCLFTVVITIGFISAAGQMNSIIKYPLALLLIVSIVLGIVEVRQKKNISKDTISLLISYKDKNVKCRGYYDTGNMLYDLKKTPVIIVTPELAEKLLGSVIKKHLQSYRKYGLYNFEDIGEIFPIYYHTISCSLKLMPGFKIKQLTYKDGTVYKDVTAGISQNNFFTGTDIKVLLHQSLKPGAVH